MEHPLANEHRTGRLGLIELGRSLSADDAALVTTACPDWSIKDVYAHLAGISTDILAGNTENAATEAWADGHVADRQDRSFAAVLDEWETAATTVDELIVGAGELFPFQLFIDQWTHEWDIRAALGERAAAVPDLGVCHYVREPLVENQQGRAPADIGVLEVAVGEHTHQLGSGASLGRLELTPFEFTRIAMGRRSRAQVRRAGVARGGERSHAVDRHPRRLVGQRPRRARPRAGGVARRLRRTEPGTESLNPAD